MTKGGKGKRHARPRRKEIPRQEIDVRRLEECNETDRTLLPRTTPAKNRSGRSAYDTPRRVGGEALSSAGPHEKAKEKKERWDHKSQVLLT